MRWTRAGLLLAACVLTAQCCEQAIAQDAVPEPDVYRMENYRAPVPATLAGARVLTTRDAEAIWRAKSGVFIDVLPRAPKPKNLPEGPVWRDKPRFNIPGSVWLPDTGYGALAAPIEDYLRLGIERAADQNWKRQLNRLIQENQPAINKILLDFGVPLLDEKDQPISVETATKSP